MHPCPKQFRRSAARVLAVLALGVWAHAPAGARADLHAGDPADVNATPMVQAYDGWAASSHEHYTAALSSPRAKHRYITIPNQVLFRSDERGRPLIAENITNIRQGKAGGDCYFLASLMAVALTAPQTIETLVHDNGDGTYTGKFYGLMSEDFWAEAHGRGSFVARVNGELPGRRHRPAYNWVETVEGQSVSWAAIIEKLWAAVNTGYAKIDGRGDSSEDDHDIENGLFAITGIMPTGRKMRSLTFEQVRHDLERGAVVVGTAPRGGKVTADHALAVLGVDEKNRTVLLGDPYGARPVLKVKTFVNTNINQYFMVPLPRAGHEETASHR